MDLSHKRYYDLMAALVKKPVHPLLRPVDLSSDQKKLDGVGTLTLDQAGQHTGVVTAGHVFMLGKRDYKQLFYRICGGPPNDWRPISHVTEPLKEDVAMCHLGPAQEIIGASLHTGGFRTDKQGLVCKATYSDCVQLTTGRKIPVLGHIIMEDKTCYYVLRYKSFPGESGSGFLRDQASIYVLSAQLYFTLGLQKSFGHNNGEDLTIATGVMLS